MDTNGSIGMPQVRDMNIFLKIMSSVSATEAKHEKIILREIKEKVLND